MTEYVIDTVEKYLRHMAAFKRSTVAPGSLKDMPYVTTEDFVLRHGRLWTPQARPRKYKKRPFKQCFSNTFEIVWNSRGKLVYVEGYARGYIDVHHAWAVDLKGNVVDTTWETPESGEYYGIPFALDYVVEVATSRELGWCMLDDWEGGHPLFSGKLEAKTWHSPHFEFVDRLEVVEELNRAGDALREEFAKAREITMIREQRA